MPQCSNLARSWLGIDVLPSSIVQSYKICPYMYSGYVEFPRGGEGTHEKERYRDQIDTNTDSISADMKMPFPMTLGGAFFVVNMSDGYVGISGIIHDF